MVQTPGWFAVSASAYLLTLSLLVLYLDGVALTASLVLVVVTGSAGLVALAGHLHPRPAVALADRRLHVALVAVPIAVVFMAVYLPGVATVSPADPANWLFVFWTMTGCALYMSAANAQARHYERQSDRVVHLRVRPTFRTRRRRTTVFGALGVVLVTIGLGLVFHVPSALSSFVMGMGFTSLFSGILGAKRPRTYRLLDEGIVRQDNGAVVRSYVPHSRIETAERDGEELCLERRGLWYPATAFVVKDEGGDRTAATRWFDTDAGEFR